MTTNATFLHFSVQSTSHLDLQHLGTYLWVDQSQRGSRTKSQTEGFQCSHKHLKGKKETKRKKKQAGEALCSLTSMIQS